jgi:hypothetical protein
MKRPRPPLRPHKRDGRTWFHVVLTVYGNWLPGDPRGFRTPKHEEHVEGIIKILHRKEYMKHSIKRIKNQ